jgi:DNA (cytosine-5)-methyltransferase 1
MNRSGALNAISLFSGCGGCTLGLRGAGFDVRLAVDIDASACETYSTNLGQGAIWRTDLSTATPKELLDRAGLPSAGVDLIVGGPPCQGFSSAGARDWTDHRNTLLRHFVELVVAIKPTWFVMENVEGLLTANDGFFLIEAITRFLAAGYWVRAEKVYMEQMGLPQRRKRVVVVGNLEECAFTFPPKTFHLRQQPSLFASQPQLSVHEAIGDLPPPTHTGAIQYESAAWNDYQAQRRRTDTIPVRHHQVKLVTDIARERIALLAEGATMKTLPKHLQHPSFTRRALRRVMDGTPSEKRGGAPSGLKRLIGVEPSLTITSAAPTEFVHPTHDRLLTLRECARLQSFPDWYEFCGSWSSIATQIANAIPPLFMCHLATHIKGCAHWQATSHSGGRWLGIAATRSSGQSPALVGMLRELEERTHAYCQ